jgi:hypothetical protein
MVKRILGFLTACFFVILIIPMNIVYADMIVEPQEQFYHKHRDECENVDRDLYINGADGFVSFKQEPGSDIETGVLENDTIVHVYSIYNYEDILWGYAVYMYPGDDWYLQELWHLDGWVPMNQLVFIYDYISFEEEYINEFYGYTGDFTELKEANIIVFWAYPCSGKIKGTREMVEKDFDNNIAGGIYFSHVYKDNHGREWGFSRFGGGKNYCQNVWVCLSDPANAEIPYTKNHKSDFPIAIIIVILIIVLVAGTAILIKIFWKPNKNKGNRV